MIRVMLSDILWDRLQTAIKTTNAYQTDNLRMTIEGILCRFRTGAPWRDLPNHVIEIFRNLVSSELLHAL